MSRSRNSETRGTIVVGVDGHGGHAPDAPSRHRGRHMPVAPVAPARRREPARPDGRRIDGLLPLWVFLIASLAIVGAVTVTGAVDSWWILVPAMAVFFISTFAVLAIIMWLLGDDAGAP
jgi:fatty acid desaturase